MSYLPLRLIVAGNRADAASVVLTSALFPLGPMAQTRRADDTCSTNYKIMLPLPPKIDPSVTMMQVEERPSVTYEDVGGCKEQIEKLREVVELPLLEVRPPKAREPDSALTIG